METAPLSRVTLIYGPNSSGKSSIIQALLLLKQSLGGKESRTRRELIPIGDHVDLGSIPALVHRHDTDSEIGIRLTYIKSSHPNVESSVELTYEPERSAVLARTKDNSVLSTADYQISLEGSAIFRSVSKYKYGDNSIAWDTQVSVNTKSLKAQDNVKISSAEDGIHYLPEVKLVRPPVRGLLNRALRETGREASLSSVRERTQLQETIQHKRDSAIAMRRDISTHMHELHKQERMLEDEKDNVLAILLRDDEIGPQEAREHQRALRRTQRRAQEVQNELNQLVLSVDSMEAEIQTLEQDHESMLFPNQRREAIEQFVRATQRTSGSTPTRALDHWNEARYWNGLRTDEFLALVPETIPEDYASHLRSIRHIGPAREQPERIYRLSSGGKDSAGIKGEYTPHVIYQNPEVKREVNHWIREFEIPYELDVKKEAGDIYITGERLFVELIDTRTDTRVSLADVGFGISCVLPIIVEGVASPEGSIICVEQPELHLHPRLQAHLANLMVSTSADESGKRKQWIVETHSELLQLRLSALIATKEDDFEIEAKDVSVIFVNPPDKEDDSRGSTIKDLKALDDGELGEDWPPGFFDESTEEMMKIIRSQRN